VASKVLDPSGANDLESYQRAMKDYNAAKEKLTKAERQIISAWDAEAHASVSGPQQN
jgi:exonuclease VII small subunit